MPSRQRSKPVSAKRYTPLDKEILNVEGAAEALGVSPRLVQQLAREGKIPGQKIGREWRFVRSDLRNCISGGAETDSLEKLFKRFGVKISSGRKR